jgi:hypothetical protein
MCCSGMIDNLYLNGEYANICGVNLSYPQVLHDQHNAGQ